MPRIGEIDAREIFVKSALPDTDYVANPYVGCRFGCAYCYASFMGRLVNEKITNWGQYVYVKRNAVETGRLQLARWRRRDFSPSILFSSVTDPYQGVERKFQLTRGLLQVLAESDYAGKISVLTKSPLVLRDSDLIRRLRNAEVGITITTNDDALSRALEVRAPTATRRLETLAGLVDRGLRTYAFLGPVLPNYWNDPGALSDLLRAIAGTGTRSIYVEELNLSPRIRQRYEKFEPRTPPASSGSSVRILDLLAKYGLELRLGKVLQHPPSNRFRRTEQSQDAG
jgi:DNA repair photolyase